MELKEFQNRTVNEVRRYLGILAKWRDAGDNKDFPAFAWIDARIGKDYKSRADGVGRHLPNFCLKLPTGAGKTLLAVKVVDLINTVYLRRKTGLVLWVVPSDQIYKQTIKNLRDKDHPYRQHLDLASGGRTIIKEKTDRFTPIDVAENLVVLMLMLPSAARRDKETLRVFKDNGGFDVFFPPEDDINGHAALLEKIPNLDYFGEADGFWGRQVKTSLGNTLRFLKPVIILDEGHKAYSETARNTLYGFNPSVIVELSATPPKESNVLVDVRGIEVADEGMIKLPLHVINKESPDWKDTLLAAADKRQKLEEETRNYEANTGIHIRPICLVQVERTGREQRGKREIHAEDAREYIIKSLGFPDNEVAVVSAELKEIEGLDLLSKECGVRFIITKAALQEGWDCPFAYVLAVLPNASSETALTQLVGRILRQPYAKKTGIDALDESCVFTFRQGPADLLNGIKAGFQREGLGDLTSRVIKEDETGAPTLPAEAKMRKEFKEAAESIVLPVFVVASNGKWRPVLYETDILSNLNWAAVDLAPISELKLSESERPLGEYVITLSEDVKQVIETNRRTFAEGEATFIAEAFFVSRQLSEIVTNPWVAWEFGSSILSSLASKYDRATLSNNLLYIIEETKKYLLSERDRLAESVFTHSLENADFRFIVLGKNVGFRFPTSIKFGDFSERLNSRDRNDLERFLYEFANAADFNKPEKEVAWFLDGHDRMLFWFRNMVSHNYCIQGWKRNRIWPDFIFTSVAKKDAKKVETVYVIETKGLHLLGSEDTEYKRDVFNICNDLSKKRVWTELGFDIDVGEIRFEVLSEKEWHRVLNSYLA